MGWKGASQMNDGLSQMVGGMIGRARVNIWWPSQIQDGRESQLIGGTQVK